MGFELFILYAEHVIKWQLLERHRGDILWVSQIWVAIFFPYGKGATGEGPPRQSKAGRGPRSASGVHAAQLPLWLWSED